MSRLYKSLIAKLLAARPRSDAWLHPEDQLGLQSPKTQFGVLLLICLLSYFIHLSAFEVNLMEARNFVTAREVVFDGAWLIPTMNGEVRIAKPPLVAQAGKSRALSPCAR